MKQLKLLSILFIFISLSQCGYSPMLSENSGDFFIKNISFEGDRKINNYISNNLKKYQVSENKTKEYSIKINSSYQKNIINKDDSGNPKNYQLLARINIDLLLPGGESITKLFERSVTLTAQTKRITEKEIEKKQKEELSDNLSKDIIFFLNNK